MDQAGQGQVALAARQVPEAAGGAWVIDLQLDRNLAGVAHAQRMGR